MPSTDNFSVSGDRNQDLPILRILQKQVNMAKGIISTSKRFSKTERYDFNLHQNYCNRTEGSTLDLGFKDSRDKRGVEMHTLAAATGSEATSQGQWYKQSKA